MRSTYRLYYSMLRYFVRDMW